MKTPTKGKILKVKHGYNPNSSSMGSMVFALPVTLVAVTVGFGVVSGLILSFFNRPPRDVDKEEPGDQ